MIIIAILLIAVKEVVGQTYVCVPSGTPCPGNVNPNTPDIRIVAPGQTLCPQGQVPCLSTPTSSNCGVRSIPSPTDADGVSAPGSFPWQVYMVNQNGFFGSGVLLDQQHVLTVAHKVKNNEFTPTNIRIYAGVWDPASMGTASNRTAARIITHPSYNPSTYFNNIALIRLDSPVNIGLDPTVGCALLPQQGQSYVGRRCIVSGWGQTDISATQSRPGPQRQVTVPIVDIPTCRAAHSAPNSLGSNVDTYLDPVGNICAGGEAQRDACTNDGGAPLVCNDNGRWTAVGLVQWGKGCGTPGLFGVYANIANYRSWIDSSLATLRAG